MYVNALFCGTALHQCYAKLLVFSCQGNHSSSFQVHGVGVDDQRGMTISLTLKPAGVVVPLFLIYAGTTDKSLPSPVVKTAAESHGHKITNTKVFAHAA